MHVGVRVEQQRQDRQVVGRHRVMECRASRGVLGVDVGIAQQELLHQERPTLGGGVDERRTAVAVGLVDAARISK